MPVLVRPQDIITTVAGLMNDAAQAVYTNTVCLPFLNLSLDILQESYQLNGIPTTYETSNPLTVPAGVGEIGYDTNPALPGDLIEITQLWESPTGLNEWTEVIKKDFLPHYLEDNTTISQFLIWAPERGNRITVIPANAVNDLKIDGIYQMFNTPIVIGDITKNLAPFVNVKTFLEFETAALCAMFIAENPTRAQALDGQAGQAINRSMGISIHGMQSVVYRRRPFRHGYKGRGLAI